MWIWNELLTLPEDPSIKVLLIDTEGFGGIDEDSNHDSRIFLFSLLLSSYFIYNSAGNIDEIALNNLNLIINLAKEIQNKNSGDKDCFPSFLWVVRDFVLKLVDLNGKEITSRQYLENALELEKGVSDKIEAKNKIKRQFKHFFKERDCVTLVRPCENEKSLQNLNSLKENELRDEFLEGVKYVRKKIFKKISGKTICGKFVNGQMLLDLCEKYLKDINCGGVPVIENTWDYLSKNQNHNAVKGWFSFFKC